MYYQIPYIKDVISKHIPKGRVVPEHTETAHFYKDTLTGMKTASVTTKAGILDAPHLKAWAAKVAIDVVRDKWGRLISEGVEYRENVFQSAILAHKDIFENAGGIGTIGHSIVEDYLTVWMNTEKQPDDIIPFVEAKKENGFIDPRAYAIARSAELFCKENEVVPVASELLVASNKYGYAGTLDALMMVRKITKKGMHRSCEHTWTSTKNDGKYRCARCGARAKDNFMLVDWKTSNTIDKEEYAMQVSAYWNAFEEMTGLKLDGAIIVRLDKDRAKYDVLQVADKTSNLKAFIHLTKVYDWLMDNKRALVPYVGKDIITL